MGKLIRELELADWFKQSILTIRRNRTAAPHRHPPYKKVGKSVLYDVDEVQRWLDAHTVNAMDAPAPGPTPVSTPKDKRPKAVPISHPQQKRHPGRPEKAETVSQKRQGTNK